MREQPISFPVVALMVALVALSPGPADATPSARRATGARLVAAARCRVLGAIAAGRDRLAGLACAARGDLGRSAARAGESVVYVDSATGTGSGFVYRSAGRGGQLLIATNHHVVSDVGQGGQVTVTLADGRTIAARVRGYSSLGDLAVLEPLARLPVRPLELRRRPVQQGEQVAVIGHPYGGLHDGVQPWVTKGLVTQARPRYAFIFDADLGEGSSGGPVVDRRGRVVGVTFAGLPSRSAGASGSFFGMGIPVDVVRQLLPTVERGPVRHADPGISVAPLEPARALALGLPTTRSVISGVMLGSPAQRSGLRIGDVILELRAASVGRMENPTVGELTGSFLAEGEVVRLTILRDGARRVVTTSAAPLESLEGRRWLRRRGSATGAQLTLPGLLEPPSTTTAGP